MKEIVFFLVVMQIIVIQSATSQELDSVKNNIDVPEVIVTRTKNKPVKKIPLSISVIKYDELFSKGYNTLDDVLIQQTGITLVPTLLGTQGVQLQGLDPSYTTILIDGYPLIGRYFGTLDLKRIAVSSIDKIEILKGASSSLYGSDALAGIINIVTKEKSDNGTNINLNLGFQSNQTINPSLLYQYTHNSFEISNSIDYYQTNGYDLISTDLLKTVNPYETYTTYSKLKYTLKNKLIINGIARYYAQNQLNTDVKSDVLLEGESRISEWNIGAGLKYFFNSKIDQKVDFYMTTYNADEFLLNQDETIFEDKYFNHNLLQVESTTHFLTHKNIDAILGAGIREEQVDRDDFSNLASQNLQFIYAQIDGRIFNKINLLASSRYDRYNEYDPKLSNKLAVGSRLAKRINLNASIGQGFKTPDLRQRYFDFTNSTIGYLVLGRNVVSDRLELMQENGSILNMTHSPLSLQSPLKPETSININLGLSYYYNNLDIGLNIFYNRLSNLIEYKQIATTINSLPIFTYFNINKVETKGVEFETRYNFEDLRIMIGYQLLYAFDTDVKSMFESEEVYANHHQTNTSFKLEEDDYFGLFNRSRHTGSIGFVYQVNTRNQINSTITYRSKYASNDSNGNQVLDNHDDFIDGYALCDIGLGHQISSIFLDFGVKNIFGFNNPEKITSIPGRVYYLNLQHKLN